MFVRLESSGSQEFLKQSFTIGSCKDILPKHCGVRESAIGENCFDRFDEPSLGGLFYSQAESGAAARQDCGRDLLIGIAGDAEYRRAGRDRRVESAATAVGNHQFGGGRCFRER